MNCYLIDDEPHAIQLLTEYIGRLDDFKVVGSNLNAKQALLEIGNLSNVDLVFTDIYMPDLSGFDLISQLPKKTQAIVTTANSYYRERATELNVSGYLLKPFDFDTFLKAIAKFR